MGLIFHPFNHPCHFLLDGLPAHRVPPAGTRSQLEEWASPKARLSCLLLGLPCGHRPRSPGWWQPPRPSYCIPGPREPFPPPPGMFPGIRKPLKSQSLLRADSLFSSGPQEQPASPQPSSPPKHLKASFRSNFLKQMSFLSRPSPTQGP